MENKRWKWKNENNNGNEKKNTIKNYLFSNTWVFKIILSKYEYKNQWGLFISVVVRKACL